MNGYCYCRMMCFSRELEHANVCKTFGYVMYNGQFGLIIEHMQGGDLLTVLQKERNSEEARFRVICWQTKKIIYFRFDPSLNI